MQLQTQVDITERFIHQKGAEKLVKDELYVASYTSLHSSSTYSNFQQKTSLQIKAFCSTGEYFYY